MSRGGRDDLAACASDVDVGEKARHVLQARGLHVEVPAGALAACAHVVGAAQLVEFLFCEHGPQGLDPLRSVDVDHVEAVTCGEPEVRVGPAGEPVVDHLGVGGRLVGPVADPGVFAYRVLGAVGSRLPAAGAATLGTDAVKGDHPPAGERVLEGRPADLRDRHLGMLSPLPAIRLERSSTLKAVRLR